MKRLSAATTLRIISFVMLSILMRDILTIPSSKESKLFGVNTTITFLWAVANWIPDYFIPNSFHDFLWLKMSTMQSHSQSKTGTTTGTARATTNAIARISISSFLSKNSHFDENTIQKEIQFHLEDQHGKDWQRRPLLLEGLLGDHGATNLNSNSTADFHRHLSVKGLLECDQVIPYFENANRPGVLSPTAQAPCRDIIRGMLEGKAFKIGSQLLLQENPDWIEELVGGRLTSTTNVTSGTILKQLFGNHFTSDHLAPGKVLPATTTVPVFIARTNEKGQHQKNSIPITGLHCEPIGNVAFQLYGEKEWTLVDPAFSHKLKPSLAKDGRAFFYSSLSLKEGQESLTELLKEEKIPHRTVVTRAGDALWVPTWTWHRVDYVSERDGHSRQIKDNHLQSNDSCHSESQNFEYMDDMIAIGGSIFHFRPWEFFRNNPLYAWMIIPALLKELAGLSTQ